MKVIIRVVEAVLKDAEIEIPDDTEDPEQYCLELYNADKLELEFSDSTCSSFDVEIVQENKK